ncbi:MAG: DNA recombination/repair protein RecA, partial [Oscillospiraceae bacterium]|nr:DNA recombination/repair protein RecA [Oscillospiraceae bacterium]
SYGNPEVTTGGRALKFYASVRIDVRRDEILKTGTDSYGNRVRCKVAKNKVAPPFKVAMFDILYGQGISKTNEIIDIGVLLGIVEKSGAWFGYEGTRLGQGKEKARVFLEENPSIRQEIEEKIRARKDAGDLLEADEDILDMDDEDEDFEISVV